MADKYAGYIRVSSKRQAEDGHSLEAQKESIIDWVQYKTREESPDIPIFADEGISGRSADNRAGLQRLLMEAKEGKFNRVVVSRISRLGRNARELLNNVNLLRQCGVSITFVKDNIDTGEKIGRFLLTVLGAVAEMEAENIGEASLDSKISLAARNIPAVGNLPFGRTFDKETGKWGLKPNVKEDIERAARDYLKGRTLREISDELCAKGYQLKYSTLLKVFKEVAGNKWAVKFKGHKEAMSLTVPELLDETLIKRVQVRLMLRRDRPLNGKSKHQYLLRQLVRCEECGVLLWTATNSRKPCYEHGRGKNVSCSCKRLAIGASHLDNAVLKTVWENIIDEEGFNAAIQANMPDKDTVAKLTASINRSKVQLTAIAKKRDNLLDKVEKGILSDDVIKERVNTLADQEEMVHSEMTVSQEHLDKLRSIKEIHADAQFIRRQYLEYFNSEERLAEMTFEEKRQLIEMFFEGSDNSGNTYGVYLTKLSKKYSRKRRYDYFIYSNLVAGSRTMEGMAYNAPATGEEAEKWGGNYKAPVNNAAVAARGKGPQLDMAAIDCNYGKNRKPKNRVVGNTVSTQRGIGYIAGK